MPKEIPSGTELVDNALREKPWRHFVVDDFLDEEQFGRVAAAARRPSREFEIEPGDKNQVEYSLLEDIDLASIFISIEFARLLHSLTGVWCYLGEGYVQVRRATPETPEFPVHVDSGGPRAFVALLYVTPDWSPSDGGGLHLHETETGPVSAIIDPIPNRLVVFEAAADHWHGVEKTVRAIRYSLLSEWLAVT